MLVLAGELLLSLVHFPVAVDYMVVLITQYFTIEFLCFIHISLLFEFSNLYTENFVSLKTSVIIFSILV